MIEAGDLPGVNLSFSGTRTPVVATKGRSLDHIGFDVRNLEAFTKKQLNGLLKDKEALTGVLTHHVVAEQISPDQLTGEFETLAGDTITINGSGEEATVGDEKATVLCGNIPTANATVYVIDTVLTPA